MNLLTAETTQQFSSKQFSQQNQTSEQILQAQHTQLIKQIEKSLNQKQISKQSQIRVRKWIKKLQQPACNIIWKKNQNLYLKTLNSMIKMQNIIKPFNSLPPDGPLLKITLFDIPSSIRDQFSSIRRNRTKSENQKQHFHSQATQMYNYSSNIQYTKNSKAYKISSEQNIQRQLQKCPSIIQCYVKEIDKQNTQKNKDYTKSLKNSIKIDDKKRRLRQIQTINSQQIKNVSKQKIKDKSMVLLRKSVKLLGENYQMLCNQIQYQQIMEDIVKIGDKYNQNFREITLNLDKSKSDNQQNYKKTQEQQNHFLLLRQQVQQKFSQTGLQSAEFMKFIEKFTKK